MKDISDQGSMAEKSASAKNIDESPQKAKLVYANENMDIMQQNIDTKNDFQNSCSPSESNIKV